MNHQPEIARLRKAITKNTRRNRSERNPRLQQRLRDLTAPERAQKTHEEALALLAPPEENAK